MPSTLLSPTTTTTAVAVQARDVVKSLVSPDLERWLAQCPPAVAGLARDLCHLVSEVLPDAVITVDPDLVAFGVAAGYRGVRFTVAAYREHLNLGIAYGADLPIQPA